MIDLNRLEKIASELEEKLNVNEESLQNKIEERTEEEKEKIEVPEPSIQASEEEKEKNEAPEPSIQDSEEEKNEASASSIQASEEDKKVENTARIAHLKRLIKLAKVVKKSKKLNAEEKEKALNSIKVSAELKIKRTDLNKMLTNDVTKIMKTTTKLNNLTKEEKGITLREALKEMEKWGKENDVKVDFPQSILSKQVGSCSAEWLIKLGPMIATLLQKYELMKEKAEKDNK